MLINGHDGDGTEDGESVERDAVGNGDSPRSFADVEGFQFVAVVTEQILRVGQTEGILSVV